MEEVAKKLQSHRTISVDSSGSGRCVESSYSDPTFGIDCFSSVGEILQCRAESHPDSVAFTALTDGDLECEVASYASLYRDSVAIAADLNSIVSCGQRVLILFEPGLDYIRALFGVFISGAICVPSFPPVGRRALERLALIAADCQPTLILTTRKFRGVRDRVVSFAKGKALPRWLEIEDILESSDVNLSKFASSEIQSNQIALLQYTSGSTGNPKGVLLTHGNILNNCNAVSRWMGGRKHRVGCTWLPPYHDMGLMGGIIQPIYERFHTIIMAPGHFVQQPQRWLNAITRYRVTTTIAPNFAFDLCCDRIPNDALSGINLSSLEDVYCGAEPIHVDTYERFVAKFLHCGFQKDAFTPCYGLAEATVFVAGKPRNQPVRLYEAWSGDRHQSRVLTKRCSPSSGAGLFVCSGIPAFDHRIEIRDKTFSPVRDGIVGEICVAGPSVARGYWNNPVASSETFVPDGHGGVILRTGDLGLLTDGELIVTGRLKDVIIMSGRNIYPTDVERAAESADERLRRNGCAAFSVPLGRKEAVAVVAEIRRGIKLFPDDQRQIEAQIRSNVAEAVGYAPAVVVIVAVGTIPVTTSGKIQRQATRKLYLAGNLPSYKSSGVNRADANRSRTEKRKWLVRGGDLTGTRERRLAWLTVGLPAAGSVLASVLAVINGVTILDLSLLAGMYVCTSIGVEVGMHRFFSHHAFKAGPLVTAFLAITGSMAAQGPVLFWAATHRMHHAFTDKEGDPHSPCLHGHSFGGRLCGLWHAHVGWLFGLRRESWSKFTPDLLKDRFIMKINQLYFTWVLTGLAIPGLLGAVVAGTAYGALTGLLWGGFVRIFLVDQATWAVNSFAHSFGRRRYQTRDQSRNLSWLIIPTIGGGWHNNHHAFPALARTNRFLDPAGTFIDILSMLRLVWDVKRTRDSSEPQ